MTRKSAAEKQAAEEQAVATTNAVQERFVEMLLSGASIAEAARICRISRRTATYWMQEDTLVRFAYEHERQRMVAEFRERLTKLQAQVLSVLEKSLEDEADPGARLEVAMFLYKQTLAGTCQLAPLPSAESLVETVLSAAETQSLFAGLKGDRLQLVEDE